MRAAVKSLTQRTEGYKALNKASFAENARQIAFATASEPKMVNSSPETTRCRTSFPCLIFLQQLDVDSEQGEHVCSAGDRNGTLFGVTNAAKPSVRPDG